MDEFEQGLQVQLDSNKNGINMNNTESTKTVQGKESQFKVRTNIYIDLNYFRN